MKDIHNDGNSLWSRIFSPGLLSHWNQINLLCLILNTIIVKNNRSKISFSSLSAQADKALVELIKAKRKTLFLHAHGKPTIISVVISRAKTIKWETISIYCHASENMPRAVHIFGRFNIETLWLNINEQIYLMFRWSSTLWSSCRLKLMFGYVTDQCSLRLSPMTSDLLRWIQINVSIICNALWTNTWREREKWKVRICKWFRLFSLYNESINVQAKDSWINIALNFFFLLFICVFFYLHDNTENEIENEEDQLFNYHPWSNERRKDNIVSTIEGNTVEWRKKSITCLFYFDEKWTDRFNRLTCSNVFIAFHG